MCCEMNDVLNASTVGETRIPVTAAPGIDRTRTSLRENVGFLRANARSLHGDAANLHEKTWNSHIDEVSMRLAREDVGDILRGLSDKGFAWRDVARMVGVSVPAIQKWRRGESISGENRLRLARTAAVVQALESDGLISDPASWFEMPIKSGVAVNAIDLLASGLWMPLIELVLGHQDAEVVLQSFDPAWRVKFTDSNFESFIDVDGYRTLRPRS